jgi:hypothetical protein
VRCRKNDLIECATINDLMLGKGQVTPENIVLTGQKDFSYRLVSSILKMRYLLGFILGVIISAAGFYVLIGMDNVQLDVARISSDPFLSKFTPSLTKLEHAKMNVDTNRVDIVYKTGIPTEQAYYFDLERNLSNTEWKQVDKHRGYRMYIEPWKEYGLGAQRRRVEVTTLRSNRK